MTASDKHDSRTARKKLAEPQDIQATERLRDYYDLLHLGRMKRGKIRGLEVPFLMSERVIKFLEKEQELGKKLHDKFGKGITCERVIEIILFLREKRKANDNWFSSEQIARELFLREIDPEEWMIDSWVRFIQEVSKGLNDIPILETAEDGKLFRARTVAEFLALEKVEETLPQEKNECEPEPEGSFHRLTVRFRGDTAEVLDATGRIFQERQLQPAAVRLRGPKSVGVEVLSPAKRSHRDFVTMTQEIGRGTSTQIRVVHAEDGKHTISVLAFHTATAEHRKGIEGLRIRLMRPDGSLLISRPTSADGTVELGDWGEGNFIVEVSDKLGKLADVIVTLTS